MVEESECTYKVNTNARGDRPPPASCGFAVPSRRSGEAVRRRLAGGRGAACGPICAQPVGILRTQDLGATDLRASFAADAKITGLLLQKTS